MMTLGWVVYDYKDGQDVERWVTAGVVLFRGTSIVI